MYTNPSNHEVSRGLVISLFRIRNKSSRRPRRTFMPLSEDSDHISRLRRISRSIWKRT